MIPEELTPSPGPGAQVTLRERCPALVSDSWNSVPHSDRILIGKSPSRLLAQPLTLTRSSGTGPGV